MIIGVVVVVIVGVVVSMGVRLFIGDGVWVSICMVWWCVLVDFVWIMCSKVEIISGMLLFVNIIWNWVFICCVICGMKFDGRCMWIYVVCRVVFYLCLLLMLCNRIV